MPDLTALLSDKYEAYDSGVIGELDVRTMAKQFGREDDAFTLAPNWDGGAYVAVKRITATASPTTQLAATDKPAAINQPASISANKSASAATVQATNDKSVPVTADKLVAASDKLAPTPADKPAAANDKPASPADKPVTANDKLSTSAAVKPLPVSTHDLALLYVSRWKTFDAAQRFLQIYQDSLSKRVTVLNTKTSQPANCSADGPSTCGPLWSVQVTTDEGPIFLEIWPKNLVFISQSFDEPTAGRLRQAVLYHIPNGKTQTAKADLSLRLLAMPEFQGYQEEIGQQISSELSQLLLSSQVKK